MKTVKYACDTEGSTEAFSPHFSWIVCFCFVFLRQHIYQESSYRYMKRENTQLSKYISTRFLAPEALMQLNPILASCHYKKM